MYGIEQNGFGFHLTFSGLLGVEEMRQWLGESEQALTAQDSPFGVLVDMRKLKPLASEAKPIMAKGQELYKETGMERSAVILSSQDLAAQLKGIAKESGIYEWERYIDASSDADWRATAEDWIVSGTDPD